MKNSTYLNRYRRSLLAKQRELLTANSGRLVLSLHFYCAMRCFFATG
jgi:hypothetical protein